MKITYLELPDGDKLISYYRHDFKSKEIDGELYYIDGGQSSGYIRVGGNPDKCKTVTVELEEIFDFIRDDMILFSEASPVLLKNLETDMIEAGTRITEGLLKELCILEIKHRDESKGIKKK